MWCVTKVAHCRAEPTCYRIRPQVWLTKWSFLVHSLRVMLRICMIRLSNCDGLSRMTLVADMAYRLLSATSIEEYSYLFYIHSHKQSIIKLFKVTFQLINFN